MSVAEILSKYTDPSNPSNLTGVPLEVLMSLINKTNMKKEKKSKKVRDPKKPKRPLNAYFMWMADGNRDRIKATLKTCKAPEITRESSKQWKNLSEDEKKPYEDRAKSSLRAWKDAMLEYNPPEMPTIVSDELPIGGEMGYSQLYKNKYLKGYVKGENGRPMVYADLETAIRASFEIEECGGVTAEPPKGARKRWRYTLRMGGEGEMRDSSNGEASWVKLDGGAPARLESPKPEKDPEPEPEPVPEESKKDERHVEGAYLSGVGIPVGLEDDEDDEDDGFDDEETEVVEFEYQGKTYVYDEDGNIYDPELDEDDAKYGEVIGKYVDGVPQW